MPAAFFAIMKIHLSFAVTAAACLLAAAPTRVSAENPSLNFIYETPREFFGSGDFDGDGRTDLVIVDKESGKFRLGYQQAAGGSSGLIAAPAASKASPDSASANC